MNEDDPLNAAQLVVPAIRAEDQAEWAEAEKLAGEGFGGFLLFGGEWPDVRARIERVRAAAPGPIVVYSDLERGAGQQVTGLTRLPHLMAVGAAGDEDLAYRAGRVTGEEARAAGVDVVFAPVVDLNTDPANPIINVRALGDDPERVGRLAAAWIRGCQEGGAAATAKHYPGHGHTPVDSHLALPTLGAPFATLTARELAPFRAAVGAGVRAIMTAHMAVPALTGDERTPVTLSRRAIGYLRREMGFDGLVVTDALLMAGISGAFDEAEAAVLALEAGCDVLLCPADPRRVRDRLEAGLRAGEIEPGALEAPRARIRQCRPQNTKNQTNAQAPVSRGPDPSLAAGLDLALELAARSLVLVDDRGRNLPLRPGGPPPALVILSGDDVAGPGAELAAEVLARAPAARVFPVGPASPDERLGAALDLVATAASAGSVAVVAVFSRIAAWKGASGLPEREARLLADLVRAGAARAAVVSFASPYLLARARGAGTRVAAWSDEAVSQRAAARALFGEVPFAGTLPVDENAVR